MRSVAAGGDESGARIIFGGRLDCDWMAGDDEGAVRSGFRGGSAQAGGWPTAETGAA